MARTTERDEQLMERAQAGDAAALSALFERHRDRLFAFLARRCGDAAAAEDLLQETWLRVVRSLDRYDPRRRFTTWLYQLANNLSRDRARRLAVDRKRLEGAMDGARAAREERREPAAELDREVWQRLARLPDPLREVLVLRYYGELSEGEIAEVAGVPRGTVKSRLHAAIRRLREEGSEADGD